MAVLPSSKPPPKIHSITGRLSPSLVPAGRCTLMVRQSSWPPTMLFLSSGESTTVSKTSAATPGTFGICISSPSKNCGHCLGNNVVASTFPRDWLGFSGTGGLRRLFPTGGWAKGIPLKFSTKPPAEPMKGSTLPSMVASGVVIFTVGPNSRFSLADFILGAAWAPILRSRTQTNVEIILSVLGDKQGFSWV